MLRFTATSLVAAALILGISGCAPQYRSPVVPYTGGWFNQTGFPVDIKYKDGNSIGPKEGRAKSSQVLFLIAWGDASIATAAREGGISTVDHVDAEVFNILGLYSTYETIVYGQ